MCNHEWEKAPYLTENGEGYFRPRICKKCKAENYEQVGFQAKLGDYNNVELKVTHELDGEGTPIPFSTEINTEEF